MSFLVKRKTNTLYKTCITFLFKSEENDVNFPTAMHLSLGIIIDSLVLCVSLIHLPSVAKIVQMNLHEHRNSMIFL